MISIIFVGNPTDVLELGILDLEYRSNWDFDQDPTQNYIEIRMRNSDSFLECIEIRLNHISLADSLFFSDPDSDTANP